jgi:hypothetical protein
MAEIIYSEDGKYMLAKQDDRNLVVYERVGDEWIPRWDKWSYEDRLLKEQEEQK